jgi:hypothetical protein
MKKNLITAVLMTIATTVLLGIIYPLVVTGLAKLLFPGRANGQLIERSGKVVGSRIIGQAFTGPGYFHFAAVRGRQQRLRCREFRRLQPGTDQPEADRPCEAGRCVCAGGRPWNAGADRPGDCIRVRSRPRDFARCRRVPGAPRRARTRNERRGTPQARRKTHAGQATPLSGRAQSQRPGAEPRSGLSSSSRKKSREVRC